MVAHGSPAPPHPRRRGPETWRADDITPEMIAPYQERFNSCYTAGDADDCWPWRGYVLKWGDGYGKFSRSSREHPPGWLAHRMAWVYATGRPLIEQLTIDHLCRNRLCVNPRHLEPVTLGENTRRANWVGVTAECRHGHRGEVFLDNRGKRACRQCRRDAVARAYRRKKGGLA